MPSIKLSGRLEAIARLIPRGGVADVGTDHGYIPVYLALNAYEGRIVATDIKKAPLERARKSARAYGQAEKIEFRLCDGLSAPDGGIETVVIAGMGGENIARIIEKAPWLRENGCLLILQPMTKAAFMRAWLYTNGFAVCSEQLVEDGAVYELLRAHPGEDLPYSPAELLLGHTRLIAADPLFARRLDGLIEKYERVCSGLGHSAKTGDPSRLTEAGLTLDSLKALRNG
ncbi:MAG: class I SAM-dependent methyltransferase [Oscillospiraceae bacterium]|nr:class I SAM-dependent methyltransferase [Oscillospiraceae bacterium]